MIAVALALFAFSTILGWALYGSRCCEFIFGSKAIRPYQVIYVLMIVVGATVDLELVWNIADTLNGLMALPNLIALAPFVRRGGQMYQGVFCQGKISGRTEINWKQESHGTGRCSMGFFDSWRRKIVQRRKGKMRKPLQSIACETSVVIV